jgi:hypothetical protein
MRLLGILGLCFMFSAVAYAGDGTRICEPCDRVDEVIYPMDTYQTVSGTTVGQSNADYAYRFCAVAGGAYRFTFCEGGGYASYDTGLSVQPDGCGGYFVCNDDYCGVQSQVDFTAPYAGNFVIVVDGYSSATGSYTLAYRGPSAPSPAEDSAWGSIKALFR